MRIKVSDSALVDDLAQYLRECGLVVDPAEGDTLEAFLLTAPNERAERMEVGVYLTAWQVRNEGVSVQILDA